jgi:hypothetical protein
VAYVNVKALRLLKLNIRAVMAARRQTPADLARALSCDPSTIHKLIDLNRNLNIQIVWLDRLHKIWGLAPYELFLPSIDHLTERRAEQDRRSGIDRRVGWPIAKMREVPRAKETLSPRLVELVELGEKLEGEYFDTMVRWGRSQLLRQGLRLGPTHHPDQMPIIEQTNATDLKPRQKKKKRQA